MWRFIAVLLLPLLTASAMNPPALLWEREYYTDRSGLFYYAIQTFDGGFAVAAGVSGYTEGNRPIIKLDEDGNIEWYAGNIFNNQSAKWVIQLPDSSYIGTGTVREQAGDSYGVYLLKVDPEGTVLWTRSYDFTDDYDIGWCVTSLPDGGFAVCGEYNEYDAFVMRTDANGDSLWMRTYTTGFMKTYRVLYWDDGLTVFADELASYGPIILRYSMDGDLEWVQNYSGEFPGGMGSIWGGDLCLASEGGGYMMVTDAMPEIARIDWDGELLWHQPIPGSSTCCGLSLQPTMDGGYIFSGWGGIFSEPTWTDIYSFPVDTGSTKDGWLAKLDAEGNEDWHIYHSMGPHHNIFYSASQLQGGGYIVAGQIDTHGYLLRYAPETGIDEGAEPSLIAALGEPAPNPSSGDFSISYTLPEVKEVDLAVYDLAGRRVGGLFTGTAEPGSHQVIWDPGDAPSGCYLVVLRTDEGMETRHCVLLR